MDILMALIMIIAGFFFLVKGQTYLWIVPQA